MANAEWPDLPTHFLSCLPAHRYSPFRIVLLALPMVGCRVMTREGWIGVAQAGAAAVFLSWGAILVRWAQPLSPTEVTSLRMLLGGVFVGVAAWGSGERLWLRWSALRHLLPSGSSLSTS